MLVFGGYRVKRVPLLGMLLILITLPAYPQKKESQRVANAGRAITEILGIPDNIPQDLIDKAECAIVLPGVLKFAIGVGGSYGRGVNMPGRANLPRGMGRAIHDRP